MRHRSTNRLLGCLLAALALALAGPLYGQAVADEAQAEQTADSQVSRVMVSSGSDNRALAEAFGDQARWLEPQDHERTLALFMPERTDSPEGAVLILADEGRRASDGLAGALREPFARAGWATLSVGLPALPLALEQARQQQEEAAFAAADDDNPEENNGGGSAQQDTSIMIDVMDEGEGQDAREDYDERIDAQLASALELLEEEGYARVALLGIGRGAGVINRLAADSGRTQPGLIWVAAEFGPVLAPQLPTQLQEAGARAVLDIVSHRQRDEAVDRRGASLSRAGLQGYSQQRLGIAHPPRARNARQIVNRVSGWLAKD